MSLLLDLPDPSEGPVQPLGVFPLPAGFLVLPPAAGADADTARRALLTGDAAAPLPPPPALRPRPPLPPPPPRAPRARPPAPGPR
ncbi:MAG TPA: hypothetical protein DD490_24975, partial [Acidobacteria bacterium]|nr:hypothetical protein [Acidobacteriota bacterium]